VVNYNQKLYSVAELLASGYATFSSNGRRMSYYSNIEYHTHPTARLYSN
jgi:hypothetical protein